MTSDEPHPDRCGAECRDGGYCENYPIQGASRCRMHGGVVGDGAGAPEGNTNAVSHGAYAEPNRFYQELLDDRLRQLVDDIQADYLETYEAQHGEPPLGLEGELFRISVSHVKDIVLENWAVDRPEDLDPGNPLVAAETHYSESGQEYHRYKETVVLQAQKRLSSDRRQWLKDLGLLEDPESQRASAEESKASALRELMGEADRE